MAEQAGQYLPYLHATFSSYARVSCPLELAESATYEGHFLLRDHSDLC